MLSIISTQTVRFPKVICSFLHLLSSTHHHHRQSSSKIRHKYCPSILPLYTLQSTLLITKLSQVLREVSISRVLSFVKQAMSSFPLYCMGEIMCVLRYHLLYKITNHKYFKPSSKFGSCPFIALYYDIYLDRIYHCVLKVKITFSIILFLMKVNFITWE